MQQLALAGQQRVVDRLGEQGVAEAEAARRAVRLEHLALDRLAQRLRERKLVGGHHRCQQPVGDVAPRHGGDAEHLPGGRVEAGHLRQEDVAQSRRQGRLTAGRGGEQLAREERIALRAHEDRLGHRLRERVVAAGRDDRGDVVTRQRSELPRGDLGRAGQAGDERLQALAGAGLVAAVAGDEEDLAPRHRVGEVRHQVERRLVGPVQVLQHQHDDRGAAEAIDDREHLGEEPHPRLRARILLRRRRRAVDETCHQPRQLPQVRHQLGQLRRAAQGPQRVDDRQVRQAGSDQLDAAPFEHRRAAGVGARGELADQPRLADPRRAADQQRAAAPRCGVLERGVELSELGRAADEPGRDANRLARVGRRRRERAVLVEDLELQLLDRLGRLDAQLVVERAPEALVCGQRIGLAPGAVQRQHQLTVQRLAQRVLGHERLQLADRIRVTAQSELGFEALLQAGEPQLFEMRALDLGERLLGELRERRPAPQVKRLAQPLGRRGDVARRERGRAFAAQRREAHGVDRLRIGGDEVAGRLGAQHVGGQHLAQLRDVDLDHLRCRRGHVLAPQVVDQPMHRDRAVGAEHQPRQQRALLAAAKRERRRAVVCLQRAEDPKLHGIAANATGRFTDRLLVANRRRVCFGA